MPSMTANLKMPYPLGSDPVADGDNQMRALAERVDARVPWGILGYQQSVVAQGPIGSGTVAIGSLSGIVVGSGRRIHVAGYVAGVGNSGPDQQAVLRLVQGATEIQMSEYNLHAQGFGYGCHIDCYLTPAAGTYSFALTMSAQSGTVQAHANATRPQYLVAEDMGPVSLA